MKKTIVSVLLASTTMFGFAQTTKTAKTTIKKDSIIVYYETDEMEDKKHYFPSGKIAIIDEVKKCGFSVSAFIEEKENSLTIRDLCVKMVNIGSCVENNEIIFLFEDGTKLNLKSWNDFNCDGDAWFNVDESEINQLSTKKIKKIKVTNGRTFDSHTGEVSDLRKNYFIELFYAINNNKVKEFKEKK